VADVPPAARPSQSSGSADAERQSLGRHLVASDGREEADVTDILIRDVPDDGLAAIDANAARLGLSRTAYLRRALERERTTSSARVAGEDFERLSRLATDLG
jgi:hypothetical protein